MAQTEAADRLVKGTQVRVVDQPIRGRVTATNYRKRRPEIEVTVWGKEKMTTTFFEDQLTTELYTPREAAFNELRFRASRALTSRNRWTEALGAVATSFERQAQEIRGKAERWQLQNAKFREVGSSELVAETTDFGFGYGTASAAASSLGHDLAWMLPNTQAHRLPELAAAYDASERAYYHGLAEFVEKWGAPIPEQRAELSRYDERFADQAEAAAE